MNVTEIPFNKFLGITKDNKSKLVLPAAEQYTNHLGTVHASAQFALGEAMRGEYLMQRFDGELQGMIIAPVVRKSEI